MKKIIFGLFTFCMLTLSLHWYAGTVSADSRESREHLVVFDRQFVAAGVNNNGQMPREVAVELANEIEGVSNFDYVPEIGFTATLTEEALDVILVYPDVNMEFGCTGGVCGCNGAIDCAWLAWYCAEAGGIQGFDNECHLP